MLNGLRNAGDFAHSAWEAKPGPRKSIRFTGTERNTAQAVDHMVDDVALGHVLYV